MMRRLFLVVLLAPVAALAATQGVRLDPAPIDVGDAASIQRGAQVFVNYCLNCHSAQYMRYNRLLDLGLTEPQIRDNLLFTADKVGETMSIAARAKDQQAWFGVAPPDLSVVARSRGADWLYTYLRTYYRDDKSATGWNNLAFPNVAMPHVLWELQGTQIGKVEEKDDGHGGTHKEIKLELVATGTMPVAQYDRLVADLVNYLVFMGEPAQTKRQQIGYAVLMALGVLFVLVYLLKKEFWKDVH